MTLEKLKARLKEEIDALEDIHNENIRVIQIALIHGLKDKIKSFEKENKDAEI